MILSTVNFVNNHKFSDFIIDRITEEQRVRDEETRRKNKRHSLCVPADLRPEIEWSVKKRSSLRGKTGEERFCKELDVESVLIHEKEDTSNHALVTIETTDSYTLTGDPNSLHISLKKRAAPPSDNHVFRRLEFPVEVEGQGHAQLMVFQLHSNPSYYLATTQLRHLELQSYCEDTLDPEDPDERFFRCFRSEYGVQILQPNAHKGHYIHHIDDFINVRKFELNLRPPEEYYLHIKDVDPETLVQPIKTQAEPKTTDTKGLETYEPFSTKQTLQAVPDISKSSLKRKDSKKQKSKDPTLTPKTGMLSCFGIGSRRKDKSKR